jgi:hypothetical protein
MGNGRQLLRVFLRGIWGFLLFVIILVLLNLVNFYFKQPLFDSVVVFLNNSVIWIVLFALLFLFGDLFKALNFPFNLPGPLFDAVASVFLIKFIFDVLRLINDYLGISNIISFNSLYALISGLVFVLVIIVGYVKILSSTGRRREKEVKKVSK